MIKSISAAALALAFGMSLAHASDTKPLVLPKPLPPAPAEKLPLNMQVNPSGGVYVPLNKSGNVGVIAAPLPKPAPGEKGGVVGIEVRGK